MLNSLMLTHTKYKPLVVAACAFALLAPVIPSVTDLISPTRVAYAAVVPLEDSRMQQAADSAKLGGQALTIDPAAAPDPAPTFDSFWATPQKVLDHRAAVARAKASEKRADAWEERARKKIVEKGAEYVGITPYVFGGETPSGWDCSGYTMYVLRETLGINVGHGVLVQRAVGKIVKKEDAKPGDMVVFSSATEDGFHMGIYIGNDKMEHAPQPGSDTKISSIYWDPSNKVQFVNMLGLSPDAPAELDHWDAGVKK